MKKLLALLVAGVVSAGVLAQTTPATPIAPVAPAPQATPNHAKTVKKHKAVGHKAKKTHLKSKKRAKKM